MKKKLLSSLLVCAAVLTLSSSAMANECAQDPCNAAQPPQECNKPCPPDIQQRPPMSPEERKAEFEKRIQLTDAQKAKLEKIKADEKKTLEPVHKKMQKKHEEMRALIKQENDVRAESMKKFEAILTTEQKTELEKMKTEIQEQMKKDFEARKPHHMEPGSAPMGPAECSKGCPLNK